MPRRPRIPNHVHLLVTPDRARPSRFIIALGRRLGSQGAKKGDLSKFIEEAVR